MEVKDWIDLIAAIFAGMATAIPLLFKLIQTVQQNVREQNWSKLISIVVDLMEDAEGMFDEGATRKEWVIAGAMNLSQLVDYDVDENMLSDLIDLLVKMSKSVNAAEDIEK
jgi:hypothetical protein